MFGTITLCSNLSVRAEATPRADGRYDVHLEVEAKKMRADGQGVETKIPIDDSIDIGVFGEREVDGKTEETVLYLRKRRIDRGEMAFDLVVDEKPVRAGIDPWNKRIDRNSDDNGTRVEAG